MQFLSTAIHFQLFMQWHTFVFLCSMNITTEIVLKRILEISRRHVHPDPSLGIDSLALSLGTGIDELRLLIEKLVKRGILMYVRREDVEKKRAGTAGTVKLIV